MMVLRNTFGTKLSQEGGPFKNKMRGLKRDPSEFSEKMLKEAISNPYNGLTEL